jgi:hypothetical protein
VAKTLLHFQPWEKVTLVIRANSTVRACTKNKSRQPEGWRPNFCRAALDWADEGVCLYTNSTPVDLFSKIILAKIITIFSYR